MCIMNALKVISSTRNHRMVILALLASTVCAMQRSMQRSGESLEKQIARELREKKRCSEPTTVTTSSNSKGFVDSENGSVKSAGAPRGQSLKKREYGSLDNRTVFPGVDPAPCAAGYSTPRKFLGKYSLYLKADNEHAPKGHGMKRAQQLEIGSWRQHKAVSVSDIPPVPLDEPLKDYELESKPYMTPPPPPNTPRDPVCMPNDPCREGKYASELIEPSEDESEPEIRTIPMTPKSC